MDKIKKAVVKKLCLKISANFTTYSLEEYKQSNLIIYDKKNTHAGGKIQSKSNINEIWITNYHGLVHKIVPCSVPFLNNLDEKVFVRLLSNSQ